MSTSQITFHKIRWYSRVNAKKMIFHKKKLTVPHVSTPKTTISLPSSERRYRDTVPWRWAPWPTTRNPARRCSRGSVRAPASPSAAGRQCRRPRAGTQPPWAVARAPWPGRPGWARSAWYWTSPCSPSWRTRSRWSRCWTRRTWRW